MEITTKQAAIALDVSEATITRYSRMMNIPKERRNGTLMMILHLKDFIEIAKKIDCLYGNTKKQDMAGKYITAIKRGETGLSLMQQEHPLVKNPKMFITGWFPQIDSYEFLTECNTVRMHK